MESNWIHPAIFFLGGSFILPFFRGKARQVLLLLIPALAFITVALMPYGTFGIYHFLGQEIIFGRVDKLSLVFAFVFTIIAFVDMIYAIKVEELAQHIAAFFYIGSSLGVVFAGDYLTLFIFWEIMAFASAYLIFAQRERISINAAFRYLLVHTFGGVCLLGGIVAHYLDTHSMAFNILHNDGSLGFYLILIGFMVNAAVPPLHAWLPDAYPEATITGAVFLSAFTTKTAVYVLIRAFPGTEILIWLGAIMAFYGMFYAIIQDNMRRLLAYSIISQVGYMVVGVGLGTELSLNGSAAHAFAHILYKALLFMSVGAIMYTTGKKKLSELGGLYKSMPVTMILYIIGGLSISALPLFSGFVTKSMIISAASEEHRAIVSLLLELTAAGTFLYTTLKLPYYAFFGQDKGVEAKEPPSHMLIAMALTALLCIGIGVFPGALYRLLPHPVHFHPYTGEHIIGTLSLVLFTALGFAMFVKRLQPQPYITLDIDWFYRLGARVFMWFARGPVAIYEEFITTILDGYVLPFIYALSSIGLWTDRHVIDFMVNAVARFILALSATVRRLQSGLVQHYAVAMAGGLVIIILIYSLIGG